jgi:sulfite reductase (NADPH) hemoprotein beta-component
MNLVTGHDLKTGVVIYLDAAKAWTHNLSEAAVFSDEESQVVLAEAKAQATSVTNVYLVEADGPGQPSKRVAMREFIRGRGPTVRLDLGKQAGDA